MLALFARGGSSSVRIAEGLVAYPIEAREADSVLAYVAENAILQTRTVNAQWQGQTEINSLLSLQSTSGAESALQQLAELLQEMNLKANLPQLGDIGAIVSAEQQALTSVAGDATTQAQQPAQFVVRDAPYTVRLGRRVYKVMLLPISARPSLNDLDQRALRDYLVHLGLARASAERLAGLIASWRGDAGARDRDAAGWYLTRQVPYAERGERIDSWAELEFLREMAPDDVDLLRRNFVLHGVGVRVDADFFDASAIAALADISPAEAARALAQFEPLPEGQTRPALEDEIGSDAAAKFVRAVYAPGQSSPVTAAAGAAPVIVAVSTGGFSETAVLDLSNGTILERLEGEVARVDRAAGETNPAARAKAPP